MAVEPQDLRAIMRRWATGVTLVTARDGAEVHGMTVSSFTSVSLEPPLVLVSLENDSRTHRLVTRSRAFAVAVLHEDQRALADRFAGATPDGGDRFEGLAYESAPSGSPLPAGCLAYLDCRLAADHPAGTHTLFIGEVLSAQLGRDGRPLLYYERDYRRLAG